MKLVVAFVCFVAVCGIASARAYPGRWGEDKAKRSVVHNGHVRFLKRDIEERRFPYFMMGRDIEERSLPYFRMGRDIEERPFRYFRLGRFGRDNMEKVTSPEMEDRGTRMMWEEDGTYRIGYDRPAKRFFFFDDNSQVGCYVPMEGESNVESTMEFPMMLGGDTCWSECSRNDSCLSYQISHKGDLPTCTMHLAALESLDGVDFYMRQRCDSENQECGDDEFVKTNSTRIRSGEGFPVRDTVEKCSKKCRSVESCYGFDFVTGDNPYEDTRCWIHNFESVADDLTDLYVKVQCS